MKEQERIEQIEAYLSKTMDTNARIAFEQELNIDTDLAESLLAYKEMQLFLRNSKKNQFRNTLVEVRNELENNTKSNTQFSAKWLIAISLLLLTALFTFLFLRSKPEETKTSTNPTIFIDSISQKEQVIQDTISEKQQEQKIQKDRPTVAPKPSNVPKSSPKTTPQKTPPPIAANFEPNPLLEAEIKEQLRGGDINVQLEQPNENALFNSKAPILFEGTLETDYTAAELDIRILLFNNKIEDYQKFTPVWKSPLIVNEGFSFSLSLPTSLEKGLYYYIIEDLNKEIYLKVGKFEVR